MKAFIAAYFFWVLVSHVESVYGENVEKMNGNFDNYFKKISFIFAARTEFFAGDSTILYVILNSEYRFNNESIVDISSSLHLTPIADNGKRTSHEKRYKIYGTKSGKYQILVQLRNIQKIDKGKKFKESKMVTVKILDKSSNQMTALGGVIIGALIGLMTSFGTTLFNEMRVRKQNRIKSIKWVYNSMMPQIIAARKRIQERQDVVFTNTMNEFYELGCYSILTEISSKKMIPIDLGDELIEMNSLFDEYNKQLGIGKVSIEIDLIKKISEKIDSIIGSLGRNKGTIE